MPGRGHLPVGAAQRFNGAIQIEVRITNGREEPGRQRQIEFDAGRPVTTLATIQRQMNGLFPGFQCAASAELAKFVVCHPDLGHVLLPSLLTPD